MKVAVDAFCGLQDGFFRGDTPADVARKQKFASIRKVIKEYGKSEGTSAAAPKSEAVSA